MHISFAGHSVELGMWNTKEDLVETLRNCEDGRLLFESPEQEIEFHSAIVWLNGNPRRRFGIGICSEGHGVFPLLLPLPQASLLVLGFNSNVVGVSVQKREVAFAHPLDSLFFTFMPVPEHELVLVQHEIGLLALKQDGQIAWRFSKDIITDLSVESDRVYLQFMDSPPIWLSIATGKQA